MFTGLVEELGSLRRRDGHRFEFTACAVLDGCAIGDSIAVNGCCLTVVELLPGAFATDVVQETLDRTSLEDLEPGGAVNLERPMRADGRYGGHIVQGHVDGVGTVVVGAPDLRVRLPDGLERYVVEKGSIAVDGVSLTVVDVVADVFSVAVIPHTAAATTLGRRLPGDRVNIEVDIVAKYVERLVAHTAVPGGPR